MNRISLTEIEAGLRAIATLENDPAYKERLHRATAADDPDDYVKKIEAMRKSFRSQANQTKYESQQRLASLFREMSHVFTDLIHSMALVGDDTNPIQKLSTQIIKLTKSLSFTDNGEDENGNLVNDDDEAALLHDSDDDEDSDDEDDTDLGNGKTNKNADNAFKKAIDSIKAPTGDKPAKTEQKPEKVTKVEKPEETEDTEDGDESGDKQEKKSDKKEEKKSDKKADKKTKSGGFVDGLLSEDGDSEDDSDEAESADEDSDEDDNTISRFVVTKAKLKRDTGSIPVIKLVVDGEIRYYKPSKKFFLGDVDKAVAAFTKVLDSVPGYDTLLNDILAREKSGYLELVSTKTANNGDYAVVPSYHHVLVDPDANTVYVERDGKSLIYQVDDGESAGMKIDGLLRKYPYNISGKKIRKFLKANARLVRKSSLH